MPTGFISNNKCVQLEPTSEGSMRRYFGFFLVSGFCSILYEIVWLRLAMAQFAVTTALVSIVLSAFMIGLGLGSWGAGRYLRKARASSAVPALRLYAVMECLIGLSALLVPRELIWGRILLQKLDTITLLPGLVYYVFAGLWIALTLVPWCSCMGATFPFAMAAIRESSTEQTHRSFSYLYLANILGAVSGAAIPPLLVESVGFRGTLHIGCALNLCLAITAFILSPNGAQTQAPLEGREPVPNVAPLISGWPWYFLFATGFTSMAVEVVWIRLFTPALGTVVYAFASLLGLYLAATYVGSLVYRKGILRRMVSTGFIIGSLALFVLLPLLLCDPRLQIMRPLRIIGILPFSVAAGFLTPMVLDWVSQGDPDRAGRGYAVNILGCVLGPLVSGFVLLPLLGERYTLVALALPWLVVSFWSARGKNSVESQPRSLLRPSLVAVLSVVLVVATADFESQVVPREVRHDSTATVIAGGATRLEKVLLVNGTGMTGLSPITKMIAHLPLAFLSRTPQSALVICFGMGTTHRSTLSWGVHSTAVELVPSVVSVFPYFHPDANQLLRSPLSQVVIDDGRLYMERSNRRYDVIVIDPPPPVEAAASSLLYSKEFYSIAKLHLASDGILQQWLPTGSDDRAMVASVARALHESFPYVRVFRSIEGWGYHFLASESPIPSFSAATLASHLPPAAAADLIEWGPAVSAEQQFAQVLNQEVPLDRLTNLVREIPSLEDDRPVNEYYILRRLRNPAYRRKVLVRLLASIKRDS